MIYLALLLSRYPHACSVHSLGLHMKKGLRRRGLLTDCWYVQGTCGAIYGVVPFVSRRSCGLCCGLVSAGGAIGGVMNQGIFFLNTAATGPYCKPFCPSLSLSQYEKRILSCPIHSFAAIGPYCKPSCPQHFFAPA